MKTTQSISFALVCSIAGCFAQATPAQNQPAREISAAGYVIRPLDVLSIRVLKQDRLTGLIPVRPDGTIAMASPVGEFKAVGLTIDQLQEAVTERLKEFLNGPIVSIHLVTKTEPTQNQGIGKTPQSGGGNLGLRCFTRRGGEAVAPPLCRP